jgi:uncharacterized membrane protein YraQ (UPF0718 family)
MQALKKATKKSLNGFKSIFILLLTVLLIISLIMKLVPIQYLLTLFQNKLSIIFAPIIGSILAGNPITSYIIGAQLLENNISLIIITAFMVSWVTVGVVQMPIEIQTLGKKFSILRNISAFILSILVAIITGILYSIL